jgi:hypothetical protein
MKVGNLKVHWTHSNQKTSQCYISDAVTHELISTGVSHKGKKDGFNRRLGLKLSFERATKNLNSKEVRKKLWETFIVEHPKALRTKR